MRGGKSLSSLRGSLSSPPPTRKTFASRPHDKRSHAALKRFPSRKAQEVLKGKDATSVVWGVLIAARKRIGDEIDMEGLDLPGVPEGAYIEVLPDMTTADVRGCAEAIAAHALIDPEELLEAATESARQDTVSSAYKKGEVKEEISRKSRERILPDDKTLEKVARYEAHLCRQLYHGLHELEALQARRFGGSAPLTGWMYKAYRKAKTAKQTPG